MRSFVSLTLIILISVNLLCNALPQKSAPVANQQNGSSSSSSSSVSTPSQPLTAGAVNSSLDFTRGMVDWFSAFVNNFWKTIPNFMNIFMPSAAGAAAGAAGSAASAIPSLPSIPSLPTKQGEENDSSPSSSEDRATSPPEILSQIPNIPQIPQLPQFPQFDKINNQKPMPELSPKNDVELINNEIINNE